MLINGTDSQCQSALQPLCAVGLLAANRHTQSWAHTHTLSLPHCLFFYGYVHSEDLRNRCMLQHLQCYNWITAVELQLASFGRQLMVNHFYSNLEKSSLLHLFLYRNIYCLKMFPSDRCFSSMSAMNVMQGGIKTQS